MIKSQIGEYIDLPMALKIIESSLIHLKDPHPKVRYATIQLIGQYCEDLSPELQHTCPKLITAFAEGLAVEEVPRVISHYFAGYLNFFNESVHFGNLGTIDLHHLIHLGLKHSLTGVSYAREMALSYLAGLSEVIQEHLAPYTAEVMEVILKLAASTGKEYMILRGRALEAATLWVNNVPNAKDYSEQIIKVTIESMNDFIILDEEPAPLKLYVISSFNRLFHAIPKVMESYIQYIFPRFIDLAQNLLVPKAEEGILSDILKKIKKEQSNHAHDHEDQDEDDEDANKVEYGFDEEEIAIVLETMMKVLLDCPKALVPYAENFEKFYKTSLSMTTTASGSVIQLKLFRGALDFLTMVKEHMGSEEFLKLYKEFFSIAHKKFESGAAFSDKTSEFLTAMTKLYSLADNTLNAEEFKVSFAFIKRTNEELSGEKAYAIEAMNEKKDEEEEDEEDGEAIKEDHKVQIAAIESDQSSLIECLGELVKHNRNLFNEKFADEVREFYLSFLGSQQGDFKGSSSQFQLVAYPVCDLLEFYSPDHPAVANLLDNLIIPLLENNAGHQDHSCLQTVSYAVGIFAQTAKKETFVQYQDKLLEILKKTAKSSPFGLSNPPDFIDNWVVTNRKTKYMLDNIGAAYGRMLKYKADTIHQNNIVNEWLKYLPLKIDKTEMQEQHEFFADLILGPKFEIFCGENESRKPLITQKIKEVREKSEAITDQGTRRKIENAYLKLTKTD